MKKLDQIAAQQSVLDKRQDNAPRHRCAVRGERLDPSTGSGQAAGDSAPCLANASR